MKVLISVAAGWLVITALAALSLWPHIPHTAIGWAFLVIAGPPLYVLGEVVSEWAWSSRTGHSTSEHPSSVFRLLVLGALFVLFLTTYLVASSFFKPGP